MNAVATWRTLLFLRFALVRNNVRRLARYKSFWVAFGVVVLFIAAALMLGGGEQAPRESSHSHAGEPGSGAFARGALALGLFTFDLVVGAAALALLLLGVRSATRGAPFQIREPDAVLLLTSPVSSRAFFAYHLFSDTLRRVIWTPLAVVGLFRLMPGVEPAGAGVPSGWATLAFLGATLLPRSLTYAGWSLFEAVEGRDPERAQKWRRSVRTGVTVVTVALILWIGSPVAFNIGTLVVPAGGTPPAAAEGDGAGASGASQGAFQSIWVEVAERLDRVASIPPARWVRAVAAGGEVDVSQRVAGGLLPLLALIVILQGVAVWSATDYYEPLARKAESLGALVRRAGAQGADSQGAVLELLHSRTDRFVRIPPFGKGPGALIWSGLTRSIRLNMAAAAMSLAVLCVVGGGVGAAVRWWGVAPDWAWIAPSLLTIAFPGTGNLVDELGRPHIYLFPGAPWRKLLAAGVVGYFDAVLSTVPFVAVVALVAPFALADVAAALLILLGAILLSQAAAALGQIALPAWIAGGARSVILTAISLLLAAPGLIVYMLGVGGSAVPVAVPVFVAFLVPALAAFAASVGLYRRAELTSL